MTITDICNIALDMAGLGYSINDYANDPSDLAKMLRRTYPSVSKYVLTYHEWSGAIAFATLGPDEYEKSYTGAATGNSTGDGTFVVQESIGSITPYHGTITVDGDEYSYSSWSGSTFTLKSGVTLTADYDATDACVVTPNNHDDSYEYMYAVPSGVLEVLDLDDDDQNEFLVEGDYIYSNLYDSTYGVRLRYTKDIRDEVSSAVVYDESVAQAIASELAYRIAPRSGKQAREMITLLRVDKEQALLDAITTDSKKAHSAQQDVTLWVDVS